MRFTRIWSATKTANGTTLERGRNESQEGTCESVEEMAKPSCEAQEWDLMPRRISKAAKPCMPMVECQAKSQARWAIQQKGEEMSTAARGSDERQCNEQVDRIVKLRMEFGRWWREFAPPRGLDNAYMQGIAWEAWKAGRKGE